MFYLLLHFNIRFAVFCKKESRNYLLQALITNIEYVHIYFSKPFHPNKNLPKFFVVIFAVCTNLMIISIYFESATTAANSSEQSSNRDLRQVS